MNNLLKKVALTSDHREFKHATLVIKGGAVVSIGANIESRHSEFVALNRLWPSKRKGCSIINIRIRKDGSFGQSRPCSDCIKLLKANGIRKFSYSTAGGFETERL